MHRVVLIGFLSLFCTLASVAQAAEIQAVRLWRAPDNTRLVFDLDGPVDHTLFLLTDPERLVLDIRNTRLKADLDALDTANTPVQRARAAVKDKNDLRVVLDLHRRIKPRSFVLKPNENYGHRLVVDLFDDTPAVVSEPVKSVETHQERRDIVIAIDAGHGGEDPGAIGPGRVREKDVVLAIARELESLFKAEQGYKPVLVRSGDYYVPLDRRRNIARQQRADFFVSIHADAFTNPQARGASVFAVSDRGATSAMGRMLAEKENAADLVGGVSLSDMDHELRQVMLDLSMTHTLRTSLDAGAQVLERMGRFATLHSRRVEQAGFAVLRSPDIPSLLVETGFISNPQEAKLLSTASHRKKLADAIFDGIKHHFEKQPPENTWLAWKLKGQGGATASRYTVQRGDTLSGIAQRHSVSLAALRQANSMSGDQVRVGQTLTIPAP